MLSVRISEKRFKYRQILGPVAFEIPAKQFVSIIGRSGVGKTTLLRIIAGLDTSFSGEVSILNEEPARRSPSCGLVFQDSRLFPWLSVLDNIAFGVSPDIRSRSSRRALAQEAMMLVGLEQAATMFPNEISGGMQRRTALGRAIVGQPALLLLDEPFTALDVWSRHRLQDLLQQLHVDRPLSTILVTHDLEEAIFLSDRILILDDGGKLRELLIELPHPRSRVDGVLLGYLSRLELLLEPNV